MIGTAFFEPFAVWEGSDLLVIAKPAGWHCTHLPVDAGHPRTVAVLQDWVSERWSGAGRITGRGGTEGGLVHRLDRDTTGLVLFALTDDAFSWISMAAAQGAFRKWYCALTRPSVTGMAGSRPCIRIPGEGTQEDWMTALRQCDLKALAQMLTGTCIEGRFRPFGSGSRKVACAIPAGISKPESRRTWTKDIYQTVIEEAKPCGSALLVRARLNRGFRHQIRAHLAWTGLPLSGDELYDVRSSGDVERKQGDLYKEGDDPAGKIPPGLCLWAYRIEFPLPGCRDRQQVELPTDANACNDCCIRVP